MVFLITSLLASERRILK